MEEIVHQRCLMGRICAGWEMLRKYAARTYAVATGLPANVQAVYTVLATSALLRDNGRILRQHFAGDSPEFFDWSTDFNPLQLDIG